MGMLNEIFKAKMTLDWTLDPAEVKRHIIQNSIYGVDLERGAVDIARLRFWLALVVDEDTPSPLPNLDYKIMQGNSLLESFEGIDLSKIHQQSVQVFEPQRDLFGNLTQPQMTIFQAQHTQDLQKLINEYFGVENAERKRNLRNQINQAVHDHIEYNIELREKNLDRRIAEAGNPDNLKPKTRKDYDKLVAERQQTAQSRQRLHELENKAERPFFLWHLFFKDVFELGGFDIVIGNPPYVRQEALGDIKPMLEKAYPKTYKGTADLLVYFVELGHNLLKSNGVFAYIVSNKWIRAGYGEGMRKLLTQNRLLELIDFGDLPVFEGATAYPCIVRFQKASPKETVSVTIATKLPQKVGLLKHVAQNSFDLKLTELDPEGWQLNNPIRQNLLAKLNKNTKSLENYINGEAYYGIKTGLSEAFVIDESTRIQLIEADAKSEEVIKPLLMGRDISRYAASKAEKYILFIPWHFPLHLDKTIKGIPLQAEQLFKTQYPAVYNHLLQFKEQLLNRNKAETGIRYAWYAMQCIKNFK
jgi:adenine-specific DNA-methyltransferase